jgi:hypothetical protein
VVALAETITEYRTADYDPFKIILSHVKLSECESTVIVADIFSSMFRVLCFLSQKIFKRSRIWLQWHQFHLSFYDNYASLHFYYTVGRVIYQQN